MELQIDTVDGVSTLEADAWNELVDDDNPFVEYGLLHTLETSGCLEPESGWRPHIVTARDGDDQLVGAVPLYLTQNSEGEFVFDWSWADAARRAGIDYYPKGVVGVPFTPVTGARLLVSPDVDDADAVRTSLVEATLNIADELQLSSVHFNFIPPERRAIFEDTGLPIRTGVQYHWNNDDGTDSADTYDDFDDFLSRFRSKKRSNIRRERRKLGESGVTTTVKTGDDIDENDMRRMYRYYLDTVHKHLYGRQYLTEEFFVQLREALPHRLHMVFAERDGAPFAGALNLMNDRRLFGRYWGCEEEVKFAHFETCIYSAVEWCIAHNIDVFEPGAGGEHKLTRGFEPTRTYSAHYVRDPGFRRAVTDFIERETEHVEAQIEEMRDDLPFKKGRR